MDELRSPVELARALRSAEAIRVALGITRPLRWWPREEDDLDPRASSQSLVDLVETVFQVLGIDSYEAKMQAGLLLSAINRKDAG